MKKFYWNTLRDFLRYFWSTENITTQIQISKYVLNEGTEHERKVQKNKKPNISLYFLYLWNQTDSVRQSPVMFW